MTFIPPFSTPFKFKNFTPSYFKGYIASVPLKFIVQTPYI